MINFEVPSPILCSPFEEPKERWWILEGQPAERRAGRWPMKLVNRTRERVKTWRESGFAGVMRNTLELGTEGGNAEIGKPHPTYQKSSARGRFTRAIQSDQPFRYSRWSRWLAGFEFRIFPLSVSYSIGPSTSVARLASWASYVVVTSSPVSGVAALPDRNGDLLALRPGPPGGKGKDEE